MIARDIVLCAFGGGLAALFVNIAAYSFFMWMKGRNEAKRAELEALPRPFCGKCGRKWESPDVHLCGVGPAPARTLCAGICPGCGIICGTNAGGARRAEHARIVAWLHARNVEGFGAARELADALEDEARAASRGAWEGWTPDDARAEVAPWPAPGELRCEIEPALPAGSPDRQCRACGGVILASGYHAGPPREGQSSGSPPVR